MKIQLIRFGTILALAGGITVIDQLTKFWAMHRFHLGESLPVTTFFSLTLVFNTGSAFGLFQGNNKALLILAFVILAVLLYSARGICEKGGRWGALGVAFVLGGALGNIIDRIRIGQVIDFLDFHVWPVFNVADSAITVGAGLLMVGLWRDK